MWSYIESKILNNLERINKNKSTDRFHKIAYHVLSKDIQQTITLCKNKLGKYKNMESMDSTVVFNFRSDSNVISKEDKESRALEYFF